MFNRTWYYYDTSFAQDPMMSFAIDDMLQVKISNDGIGKLRAWVHDKYVILGLHDARLPYLADGLAYLKEAGYSYIVRNSGGLGVVLDDGILNFTIVVDRMRVLDIDDGYEMMYRLVRHAFSDADVEAYEIERSYCPGSYDLSISGRKFAGISQRRIKDGVAVQIYLCVSGSGSERARVMREFYQYAKRGADTKFHYPDINPDSMASLSELLETELSVNDVLELLLKSVETLGGEITPVRAFSVDDVAEVEHQHERMVKRNKDIV